MNLASSDISSGDQAGVQTSSVSTFSMPSQPAATVSICSAIQGPTGQPIEVSV